MNIFDKHKFTLPELTSALLEILEEKRSSNASNERVMYDYSVIGLITDGVKRLTDKRKTFFNVPKGEITNRRKELGLTQKEVSRYCGIAEVNYQAFERSHTIMNYESMCYMWDLLYIYDGKPPDPSNLKKRRIKTRYRMSPKAKRLKENYPKMQ